MNNNNYSQRYYCIQLDDCAMPPYLERVTEFYGTRYDLEKYFVIAKNAGFDVSKIIAAIQNKRQVKVLFHNSFVDNRTDFEHKTIWCKHYYIKAETITNHHIWVQISDNQYARCVKPEFEGVEFKTGKNKDWEPRQFCWGNPEMVDVSDEECSSRLYLPEVYFETREDLEKDYQSFNGEAVYKRFFDEIFADE